ncbi:DUF3575 domain-containing protein [Aureisphaera galaxeae]|uniref:DUF3575 domain-containing protein n=1 Tax=Aureisphaera galaxeae TaxID=1538023 RepID=UPI002350C9B4|nr:DUF3575 domain-containing protein [Aureisphaera galaxeae]MDC8006344.1 DUF3575 domain-containing protein [Aureisphaera galaxeae]
MKKKILTLFLMGMTAFAMAQETETYHLDSDPKHEFRIDALEGLIVPAIDVSYEYIISKFSGAGVSAFFGFQDEDTDGYQEWAVTPYYRQYFFNRQDYGAKGFFAEGLLQVGGGTDTLYLFEPERVVEEDWTKFGIGFAIGQKWVSRNGFVVELSIGGGRYFGDDDAGPEGFFRGGASVGYRF